MSCPGIFHRNIFTVKYNIFTCRISLHVSRYRQTGYSKPVIVPNCFSILCNFIQRIAIVIFPDLHRNAADHRQRAPVKGNETSLIAFYKVSDCFFQFRPAHCTFVSPKTIWHDHSACHFFTVLCLQYISCKAVS